MRAKCILVCSKFGQNIVVTTQSKHFNVFGPRYSRLKVSRILTFDYKNIQHLAIGLMNNNCIIKIADKLMKDEIMHVIGEEPRALYPVGSTDHLGLSASLSRENRTSVHSRSVSQGN